MSDITVDIDGLPVEVAEEDWQADPDRVTNEVREARAAIAGTLDDAPAPDYDELEAIAYLNGTVPE
jgi:hypothetical protein